jgi:hypothetical protein
MKNLFKSVSRSSKQWVSITKRILSVNSGSDKLFCKNRMIGSLAVNLLCKVSSKISTLFTKKYQVTTFQKNIF